MPKKNYRGYLENFTFIISAVVSGEDFETAQRLAHTVKGAAGNLGIQEMYEKAAALENAIKKGESDKYEDLIEEFNKKLMFVFDSISLLE